MADGSLYPDPFSNGLIIAPSSCTTRFSGICGTVNSTKSRQIVTLIPKGLFGGDCHACDILVDTFSLSTLRQGSSGGTVKYLQMKLNWYRQKYPYSCSVNNFKTDLSIDGGFGSLTNTAVRAVQAAANLSVDGVVGPATWAKLSQVNVGYTYYKRPNCRTYSLSPTIIIKNNQHYRESCVCYSSRNQIPVYSYNKCSVTCDLQSCILSYGTTTPPSCTSNSPCTSCYSSCNTASNSCNPYQNHDCVTSCYGHTTYCPTNYDPQTTIESKTGLVSCPSYTPCNTCNTTCYKYAACTSCDRTQYQTSCRQCDQVGYYVDDYYEDYL